MTPRQRVAMILALYAAICAFAVWQFARCESLSREAQMWKTKYVNLYIANAYEKDHHGSTMPDPDRRPGTNH